MDLESCRVDNEPIDLEKLDGTWRLQYTSASDVLVLLDSSSRLPFFQVSSCFSDPHLFPLVYLLQYCRFPLLIYLNCYMMIRLARYFRSLNARVKIKIMEATSAMLFVGVFLDC